MVIDVFGCAQLQYDDSRSQEMIERKIQHAPPGQGTVRMLTHEEWEAVREVRPRTPFESKLARPHARIRTGEPLRMVRHTLFFLLLLHCLSNNRICKFIFL